MRELIRGHTVTLMDLLPKKLPARLRIEGYSFEDCKLRGPIVISLNDFNAENVTFTEPSSELFLHLPEETNSVTGVVGMWDCSFIDCDFTCVSIASKPSDVSKLKTWLDIP